MQTISTLRSTLFLVSTAALALPAASAQDDGGRKAWYDLRPIASVDASAPVGVDLRLHLSSAWIDSLEPASYDVRLGEGAEISIDLCLEAVERAIRDAEGATVSSVRVFAGRLEVTGDEAAHQAAQSTIQALLAIASDGVSVDVIRVPAGRLPRGVKAVLNASEATALLETLKDLPTSREDVALGRRAVLGVESVTSFLQDYDVEVAQGSVGADPTVSVLRTGLHLGLRVDLAADGRSLVTRVWGRDGELLGDMRTIELDAFAGAPIQLPRMATSVFGTSGILEPGGALVLDHDGGGAEGVIVRVTPRPDNRTDTRRVAALGEHVLNGMRFEPLKLPYASPSQGWSEPEEELAEQTSPWDSGDVGVTTFIEDVLGLPRIARSVVPIGSRAFFSGSDADRARLNEAVAAYSSGAAKVTFALEIAYAMLTAEQAQALRASGDFSGFAAEASTQRLVGSAIEGDTMMLVGGIESTYLRDHDIEIASGAMIPDPVLDTTFEGISVWCSPVARVGEAARMWFNITMNVPGETGRSVKVSSYHAAKDDGNKNDPKATGSFSLDLPIELQETHRASARTLSSLTATDWTLVTAQPVSGTKGSLFVVARATAK